MIDKALRILIIEDCQADFLLIERHLKQGGMNADFTCVVSMGELRGALDQGEWDVVLADYNIPGVNFQDVLNLILTSIPDVPVILVSGTVGEEAAVEQLKLGVWDFVLKSNLTRMIPVIERSLKDAANKRIRLAAENALLESEAKFRLHFEHVTDIIFLIGTNLKFLNISPSIERLLGYKPQDFIGLSVSTFGMMLTPESMVQAMAEILLVLKGKTITDSVYSLVAKDGTINHGEVSSAPVLRKGEIVGMVSVVRDITMRKKAEEKLVESKTLFEAVVENIPLMIFLKEATDLRFVIFNRAGEELLGYERKDLLGKNNLDLFPPEQAAHFMAKDREVLDGRISVLDIPEEPIQTAKKGQRLLHTKKVCIRADGVTKYLLGISEDITEHKILETQLRQAQKMEAIGTLAGGIAHDFNNILNVIMGYSTMVRDKLGADNPLRIYMDEVLTSTERAANLTKKLLIFSRKQTVDIKPINVNETIHGIQKMLVRLIRENIAFTLDLTDRPMKILADVGQIEQVLMNLTTNACDAMPEGGRLTIGTGLEEVDDEYVAVHGYGKAGMYAIIMVSDTGCGMDAETRQKIFEPFFTTKEIGEGTGLGLAISYGIIKQHSGYIRVYSEPGAGSLFKIYLPLIEDTAELDKQTAPAVTVMGGNETILVAEDDAPMRKLTKIVLESFGYSVITAEDGEDAITKYMENRESIDLVMLDMIMPKKSGKEVSEVIREESPQTKILFSSGYTMDIVTTQLLTESGFDFIHKPIQPANLMKKVREILDRSTTCI
jgi:PAS domain S-box-containing protein